VEQFRFAGLKLPPIRKYITFFQNVLAENALIQILDTIEKCGRTNAAEYWGGGGGGAVLHGKGQKGAELLN
jgi:hypothetical protein